MAEFEKYEKLRELGTNQYATVFEAIDSSSGRTVALFEFHEKFRNDPDGWRAIWREVLERGRIEHDNIVFPLSFLEAERQIVLPFMRGNFAARLVESPVSYESVRTALKFALRALSCLHKHGKVHGSITPGNLLFGSDEQSQAVRIGFSPGLVVGGVVLRKDRDPKYMAPEMFNEEHYGPLGPAVDLYSLGISAYEMLRGKSFSQLIPGTEISKSAFEKFHASPDVRLPSLKEVDPKAPADLVRVIDRLIQKRVADRYSTADQALAELDLQAKDVYESVSPAVELSRASATEASARTTPQQPNSVRASTASASPSPGTFASSSKAKVNADIATRLQPIWRKHKTALTVGGGLLVGFMVMSVIQALFSPAVSDGLVTVQFESIPEGATVKLPTATTQKTTPFSIQLKPGTYELVFEKTGFQPKPETLVVSPAKDSQKPEQSVAVKLLPATASVKLVVFPPESTVKLDGASIPVGNTGKYDLKVTVGKHLIAVDRQGYEAQEQEFNAPTVGDIAIRLKLSSAQTSTATTATTLNVHTDKNSPVKPVDIGTKKPPETALPAGLVASKDSPSHSRYGLPLKVEATALRDQLQEGEFPLEFALVEPGEFVFGAAQPREGELPVTRRTIETPFYVATTETTAAQFAVWQRSLSQPDGEPSNVSSKGDTPPKTSNSVANLPATKVSYEQAEQFCRWISPSGQLPSESEWERVARGAEGRIYPWGTESPTPDRARLRFPDSLDFDPDDDSAKKGPVGVRELPSGAAIVVPLKEPVYHMLGNVAEWCRDLYAAGANESADTPGVELNHVIRGGSYLDLPGERTSLTWRANADAQGAPDIGFRAIVVVEVSKLATKGSGSTPQKPDGAADNQSTPANQ